MRQAFEQYALSDRPWPALIVNHRSHSTQFCKDSLPSMAAPITFPSSGPASLDGEASHIELRLASRDTNPVPEEATSTESEPNVVHVFQQLVEAVLVEATIDVSPVAFVHQNVEGKGTVYQGDADRSAPVAAIALNQVVVLDLEHDVRAGWSVAGVRSLEMVVPHHGGIGLDLALDVDHSTNVDGAGVLGADVVNGRAVRVLLTHAVVAAFWKRKNPPCAHRGRVGRHTVAVQNIPITGLHRHVSDGGFD